MSENFKKAGTSTRSILGPTATAQVFALAMVVAAGCGSGDDPRVAVSGTASIDGKPVSEGSLSFAPVSAGPACGTAVADGQFSIVRSKGPVPGEYKVRLTTQTGKPLNLQVEDPEPPPAVPPIAVTIVDDGETLELMFTSED